MYTVKPTDEPMCRTGADAPRATTIALSAAFQLLHQSISLKSSSHWIDPASVKRLYGIRPGQSMLFLAGPLTRNCGAEVLIEALTRVLKTAPQTTAVLCGEGDARGWFEEQTRQKEITHAVRFCGSLEDWQIADLIQASDCVCLPATSSLGYGPLLEAWWASKPVVATLQAGADIIWHDVNGLAIDAHPSSLTWALQTLLSDLDHARWMGHNGRITLETTFACNKVHNRLFVTY